MSARERLNAGRAAALEGRHEEALAHFVWFYDHALEEDVAWRGVRQSYALGFWFDLGQEYPPALRALEEARDKRVSRVLARDASRQEFLDAVAINSTLGTEEATWRLFQQIEQEQPELAKQCASSAFPAIVRAGDFALAKRIMPEPEALIRKETAELNKELQGLKGRAFSRAPRRWATIKNYSDEVRLVLAVLDGSGEPGEAARLKKLALDLIQSPSVRRDAKIGFVKTLKAPPYRFRRGKLSRAAKPGK